MVTTGVDHSVLDRSLMILENEHARIEDKVAACTELEGYFNQVVKNKTDLLSSPFKINGEKLIKILLQCLEKDNNKLRIPVLLVLKPAVQLLPKGLGMGMQVASQCFAWLLKTSRTTEENVEPSCKSRTLVELFQCMSRFDDPQFLDAVMTATVGYSDHKVLIEKCVNVNGETTGSGWKDQQDNDTWILNLRLEALRFAKRLVQVCGSLLLVQFEEDLDFWLELLLPSVFEFRDVYSSVLRKEADAETRKAAREALEVFLRLVPKDELLKTEKWPKIKKDIKDSYSDKMVKLVGIAPDWAPIWCLVLDVLSAELVKKGNNHLINKLLNVEERAFKYDRSEVRVQAFICWRHLIDKLLPSSFEVPSDAIQRSVRLLVQPLQPNNAKTDIMSRQKLNTWWHLVRHLEKCIENYQKSVLVPFLVYCFGSAKSKELPPGKKFAALHIPCAKALANILAHEPTKGETSEVEKSNENVEECVIHVCKVPLINKPTVFLDVSEDLFYSIGECIVILSSRSETEMCSQLLLTIWNSLLRHVAVVLDTGEIPAEKVAKLIQDLLRLLQNLTERSSSAAPALATHCISLLLEGLVMGPHALPPAVLASPTYYVGTAQLMTGTAALFLMEVMVSRPLLQLATSHARYIPVLKAILDVGISHHNVLEFMQTVMKQLETVASAYYNVNSAERASLCIVWSNVATTITNYLKEQNCVNQGNEKHHDLGCLYLVVLFPFYHLYSITYKQTMETLSVWLELYKSFHQAAIRTVPTLDINEVCETVAMKICQALVKHCPLSANQAVSLLKAVQNIIMMIPFGDVCGTLQSSKSKSKYLLLPDRGRASKPTNYITNTMSLVVKVSQLFPMFEHTGEWYNTAGTLIMSCLETLFKNMKAANVAAAIPMVSSLSDAILSLVQINPLQDGSTKFWNESLQRMWKCYFTFIETYLSQKSVKDFLGWMSALLEAGFKHPLEEIRHITVTFWDNIVVPAFTIDNTSVPQVLKEAREKCSEKCGPMPMSDTIFNRLNDIGNLDDSISDAVFAVPEATDKTKHCQSLIQQLQDDGHILTKHQKEVFRRRKDDIPALYNSTLQPMQENSLMSESSQDTSDFTAPQRVIEPLKSAVEAKEPLIASSLKVLEPPSSLRRLRDYRKKMMIDHEGSIVLASISGDNSTVSENIPDQSISSEMSDEILTSQVQVKSESPAPPLSLTLVSDPCESTSPSSNGRKLNLESVAVRLPAPILVPSKETPNLSEAQLVQEQDILAKPEVAIRVSISTPAPTSIASSGIDAAVSFPLEEPTVCSGIVMRNSEQGHSESHEILGAPMEVQEIVELPAAPITILADKNISSNASGITGIVTDSRKLPLIEATSMKTNAGSVQKADQATKSKRKPVVVNTENPLTNYFKPVSITLTPDDDEEVDSSRKGSARTIHLSIETSDNSVSTTTVVAESKTCLETTDSLQENVPKHTEVLEDLVPSVSSIEVSTTTKESDSECEVSNSRITSSPVKVVVEKVEDFSLAKTFAALETMTPPFNIERDKESPSHEVSSSSRRKTKSPLKRNPGDPKLPPFKSNSKTAQQMQTKEQLKEVVPEEELSKTSSRLSKRKDNEKAKPLKRSSRSRSGIKRGSGNSQVLNSTMEEDDGSAAIADVGTASANSPSPSLLPAASGRASRSKTKQTRSKNTKSQVTENDVALPQNSKFSKLQANKRNCSKSQKLSSSNDLNVTKVKTDNSSLPVTGKMQVLDVLDVQNSKQNVANNRGSSKARLKKVGGDTCNSNEPLYPTNNETVDVKASKHDTLNSIEFLKPCIEMQPNVGKGTKQNSSNSKVLSKLTTKKTQVKNVELKKQNAFNKRESLNKEAQIVGVKYTKQNTSDSNDVKLSSRKVPVNDVGVCNQNTVNNEEVFQQVHNELPANDVNICDPSTINTNNTLKPVSVDETVLHFGTSTEITTNNNKDPYKLVKEEQGDIVENTTEDNAGDKIDVVKSMFPKVRLANYTPAVEASIFEVKEEKEISSNKIEPKLSARFRKSTSKVKNSEALVESDGKEVNQKKLGDILGQTACNLEMDRTLDPGLGHETSITETNELLVTEVEHGNGKGTKTQYDLSLVHVEDTSQKKRKRKLNERGLENDLNTVKISGLRSGSSRHQQGSLSVSVIKDNTMPPPRKRSKNSRSKKSEILAAVSITTETEDTIILNGTETTAVSTSAEASVMTTPVLAAIVTADTPSELGILSTKSCVLPEIPKSLSYKGVRKEGESVQSHENQAILKQGISVTMNASTNGYKEDNFAVEKIISDEKVKPRRRSRYSEVDDSRRLPGNRPRKLRSSTNKFDEYVKKIAIQGTTVSDLKGGLCPQEPVSLHASDLSLHESESNKFQLSEHTAEMDAQTTKVVSDVALLSQKEVILNSSMSKPDLKTSLQSEETSARVSESEVTPACISIGSEEVQMDSQKITDSEDVIESSQDSSASSLIVSMLPLTHKCSVSVRRIDTALEPGAKIDVSRGNQKLVVLIPQDSASPFKVLTPDKKTHTSIQQETSGEPSNEMEEAHQVKHHSATRCLYGKAADVDQTDSVQDKSLFNNFSRDESMRDPNQEISVSKYVDNRPFSRSAIPKPRSKKQTNTSKSEYKTLDGAKTDVLKPIMGEEGVPTDDIPKSRSEQQISISESEVSFLAVNADDSIIEAVKCDSPKLKPRDPIDMLKSEHSKSAIIIDGASKSRSKQWISTSVSKNNVSKDCKEDSTKPCSKQTSKSGSISSIGKEDTPNPQFEQEINISNLEDNVSAVGKEDTSKLRSKQQINVSKLKDNVSVVGKEDTLKPESKHQQINTSKLEDNVSTVGKESSPEPEPKKQIRTSESNDNVLVVKEGTPKPQSKRQINTSKYVFSTVSKEDATKPQSKQQMTISNSKGNIVLTLNEDDPKPQLKQQINTSKSEDVILLAVDENASKPKSKQDMLTAVKEDTPKPVSKQQIRTSKSEDVILLGVDENAPKPKSKEQISTSKSEAILIAVKEDIPISRSKQQIETSKSENSILTATKEDNLKPKSKQQISTSKSEIVSSVASKSRSKQHELQLDNAIVTDISKSQSQQQINTLKNEDRNISVIKADAPKLKTKPGLNASKSEESVETCVVDDASKLRRTRHSSMKKKIDHGSDVTKAALRSSSEKLPSNEEFVKDKMQPSVMPKSTYKEEGNKKTKHDHKTSSADNGHKPYTQQASSDDVSDVKKALESNETKFSKEDSKFSLPLQFRKRPANSSNVSHDARHGQVCSNLDDSVDTGVPKLKRLSQNSENLSGNPVCDNSPGGTPPRMKLSSDSDKTPPSSPKALLSSPSSLLRAFSSPSGSLAANQNHKGHHKRSTVGRAQYMVGLAVGVKDMSGQQETLQASSPVPPQTLEEIRSIIAATPPLSRKKLLYGLSDGNTDSGSSLERPEGSIAELETPPACISNLADVPSKRTLKLSFGEQGTPPSKKKRVWFPDPEVSGTRLFSAHDSVESSGGSIRRISSPHTRTKMLLGMKRRDRKIQRAGKLRGVNNGGTNGYDESPVSALSTSLPNTTVAISFTKENSSQSQCSPDLSNLASQGTVEEAPTELLNSQDAFFPPLVNCNHPIECVAPRLTTHVMWTKALVVELTRKNIHTVGDLSRLDEASVNRLPIANPKISHARAILQDYLKSLELENERSQSIMNARGGKSGSDDVLLVSESGPSSSETQRISTADVVKFIVSNRGSLATVLEEVGKTGQCSELLHQEMSHVLKASNRLANSTSKATEESISDAVARPGRSDVLEHPVHSDGFDSLFSVLPQMEAIRYFAKHNSEGVCKILTETPALADKALQSYFYSQLASGKLCHKDLFDKLFSADRNNSLLCAMQSFLMLKRSTEEILHKMPVESIMQYATSRLSLIDKIGLCVEGMMGDTSMELPVSHYQKLVQAVAKKVTQGEFTTIYYNVAMDNMSSK